MRVYFFRQAMAKMQSCKRRNFVGGGKVNEVNKLLIYCRRGTRLALAALDLPMAASFEGCVIFAGSDIINKQAKAKRYGNRQPFHKKFSPYCDNFSAVDYNLLVSPSLCKLNKILKYSAT